MPSVCKARSLARLPTSSHTITRSAIWFELSARGATLPHVTRKVVQNTRPSFSHMRGGSGHENKLYQSVPFAMPCTYCPSHLIVPWKGLDGWGLYQSVPFAMPCTYCPSHPIVLWEGMDGLRFASCLFITTTSIHFIRALYRHGSNRTVENQIWLLLDSIHKHSGNPVSSARLHLLL